MNMFSSSLASEHAKLVMVAVAASVFTLSVQQLYTHSRRDRNRRNLDREMRALFPGEDSPDLAGIPFGRTPGLVANGGGDGDPISGLLGDVEKQRTALFNEGGAGHGAHNEELIREQLARNYAFFGEEGMQKARRGSVVIVGCGGVGSWAAVMLARSGIDKLRLIDFDQVTLSSLNRHATATRADVGIPKVRSVQRFLHSVVPWAHIDTCTNLWNIEAEQRNHWLDGADWVVDAIDNISTKVDLLSYCHSQGIRVISSMGAGAKMDPSRIQSADISSTIYDPLARSVRQRLKRHPTHPVHSGIPVIYSTEVPSITLLPLPQDEFEKGDVKELAPFDDFRVRILPVLGMLPAIFGLHVATYVICDLAGKPIDEPLPIKGRKKLCEKLVKDLSAREMKFYKLEQQQRLPITDIEAGVIFEEIHRSKSVFPPFESIQKPCFIRWKLGEPLSMVNCVVMAPSQADAHEKAYNDGKTPEEQWGPEVASMVEKRRKEVREWLDAVM